MFLVFLQLTLTKASLFGFMSWRHNANFIILNTNCIIFNANSTIFNRKFATSQERSWDRKPKTKNRKKKKEQISFCIQKPY